MADSRDTVTDPLWPIVLVLAAIAERVERERARQLAAPAAAELTEVAQDEDAERPTRHRAKRWRV